MGGAFVLIYLYIYTIFFTHHISLVTYHFKTEDQWILIYAWMGRGRFEPWRFRRSPKASN